MNMEEHHLYIIENKNANYYLYVLQKLKSIQSRNIVDILAIRSDFMFMDWNVAFGALPMCSKAISYKKDMGYPTVAMLMSIGLEFYNIILAAEITNELHLNSSVISFVLERIDRYYDHTNIQYCIAAALNRALYNDGGGIRRYVTDRINKINHT
ncbi:MAG: hypothetical protein GWP10_13420 [Nitrospiraceae bacterium]|nr:hypothetical protein [Nitrospiraceae bacterium]